MSDDLYPGLIYDTVSLEASIQSKLVAVGQVHSR